MTINFKLYLVVYSFCDASIGQNYLLKTRYMEKVSNQTEAESKDKHGVWDLMWPYAGVDYVLTLCPLLSPLQNIYHGQPYARVDLNPMPE